MPHFLEFVITFPPPAPRELLLFAWREGDSGRTRVGVGFGGGFGCLMSLCYHLRLST